jgi:hypothetical protein
LGHVIQRAGQHTWSHQQIDEVGLKCLPREGFVAIAASKGDNQSEPTSHSNTTRQRQVFYLTSNLNTHMSKLCVQLVGSWSSDALHEESMPSLVTSFSTTGKLFK